MALKNGVCYKIYSSNSRYPSSQAMLVTYKYVNNKQTLNGTLNSRYQASQKWISNVETSMQVPNVCIIY